MGVKDVTARAAIDRVMGERPGRARAGVAAAAAGSVAAVLVYRLLRSTDQSE